MGDEDREPTVGQRLMGLRVTWAALVMGQVVFGAIAIWLVRSGQVHGDAGLYPLLFYLAAGMLAGGVFVGTLIRAKLGVGMTLSDPSRAGAYATGVILFLALCEGPSLLGIVAALLTGVLSPTLVVPGIALAVQAVNFPRDG